MPDKLCDICEFLKTATPKTQILITKYWSVGVGMDQPYLGRAYVSLLEHKGSLSALSQEEWDDFTSIVRKLEAAYKKAFGAEPINWGCYMNHAFRSQPYNPHVHWHVFPRYDKDVEFNGMTFDDPQYGEMYDIDHKRTVDQQMVERIAAKLKESLS